MANRKRTKGNGGRRDGSGRKATIHTFARLSVCLDRTLWEALRRYAEGKALSIAEAARDLLRRGTE